MRPLSRAAVARSSGRYTFSRAIHTLYTQGRRGTLRREALKALLSRPFVAHREREVISLTGKPAGAPITSDSHPVTLRVAHSVRAAALHEPRDDHPSNRVEPATFKLWRHRYVALASPARAIVCSPHAEVFTQRTPSTSQNPPPRCLRWGVCHLKDYTLFGARSVDAATTSPTANAPPRLAGATPRRQSLSKQPSAW